MEKAKALHELQKEQWRAISQGQYWVAKDAKRTHKQITTGRPVAEAMGARRWSSSWCTASALPCSTRTRT